MQDGIQVRLGTADDLAELEAREAHPSAQVARRHFERQSDGGYFFATAWRGAEPLGSSVLDCNPAGELCPELKDLWVYPEQRRQGVARALTSFLEQEAAQLGFEAVLLRVDPNNAAAIPMYVGMDYSPTGHHIRTTYEWVDSAGLLHRTEQTDAVYRNPC